MCSGPLLLDSKKAGAGGWANSASVCCPSQAVPIGHWETAAIQADWEVELHHVLKLSVAHRQQRKEQHKSYGKNPHLSDLVLIKPDPV